MVTSVIARGHPVASFRSLGQPIANAAWVSHARWVSAFLAATNVPAAPLLGRRRRRCPCSSAFVPRQRPLTCSNRPPKPLQRSALVDHERGSSETSISERADEENGARVEPPARGTQPGAGDSPSAKSSSTERMRKRKAAAAKEKDKKGANRVASDVEWVSDAVSGGLRAKETFGADVSADVSGSDSESGDSSAPDSSAAERGQVLRASGPPQKGGEAWWSKAIRGGLREQDIGGGVVLSEEALRERVDSNEDGDSEDIEEKIREADARVAALKARHERCKVVNPGVLELALHPNGNSVEVTRRGTRGGEVESENSRESGFAAGTTGEAGASEGDTQKVETGGGEESSGTSEGSVRNEGNRSRSEEAPTRDGENATRRSAPLPQGGFTPDLDKELSSLLRERKVDEAIRLLQDGRARGGLVSRRSYSWLVTLLCRQRRFATAHNWYLSVSQETGVRLDDTALAMLVQEAVRIGRKEEAWALLQVMRSYGYCPRVATWSAVVSVFSRQPETAEQALRIWNEVRSWRFGNQEVYTDTGAYNAALNACISLRDVPRAEALWAQMQAEGLQPNVLTYNIMLRGYALIGEAQEMLAGVESMERERVRPDVSTYNTRVAGHVALGDVAAAERVLDEVRELAGIRRNSTPVDTEPGEERADSVVAASEERAEGAEERAGPSVAVLTEPGVDRTDSSDAVRDDQGIEQRTVFASPGEREVGGLDGSSIRVDAFATEEDVLTQPRGSAGASSSDPESPRLGDELLENGQPASSASARVSDSENGQRPPSEVSSSRPSETSSGKQRQTSPLSDLLESYSEDTVTASSSGRSPTRESNRLEPLKSNGSTTDQPEPLDPERPIAAGSNRPTAGPDRSEPSGPGRPWPTLSELRDEATADTWQRKPKPDMRRGAQTVRPTVRTYTALLRGYVKEGRLREAFDLVEEMVATAGGRQEALPNVVTYTVLIDGCVRKNKLGVGRKVLEWMRRQGVAPNTVTYNTLLRGCCRERDWGAGLALWREMEEEGVEADVVTYNTMMDLCIKTEQVSEAFRWFKRLKESHIAPTVVSYTTAMRGLGLSQELAYAERLFRTMLDDPSVVLDRPAWNVVIDTFCRTGAMPLAKKVFQAMKTAGVAPDLATYGSLIVGFSRREDIGEVLVLWKEIRERNATTQELGDVPRRRGGTPRTEKAVGTTPLGGIQVDQRLCDEVLSACVRAGYYERALSVISVMEELGMAINRRKYGELFAEEQERPWSASRTQIIERSPRAYDFVEKFKAWLGLDNSYYQRDWNWRD